MKIESRRKKSKEIGCSTIFSHTHLCAHRQMEEREDSRVKMVMGARISAQENSQGSIIKTLGQAGKGRETGSTQTHRRQILQTALSQRALESLSYIHIPNMMSSGRPHLLHLSPYYLRRFYKNFLQCIGHENITWNHFLYSKPKF